MASLLPRFTVPAATLLALPLASHAQGWLGLAHSNYGGTQNLYVNPSSIADSRQKFYVGLVAADVNLYNTYLQLNMPYTPWQALRGDVGSQYRRNGKIDFKVDYLTEQLGYGTESGSVSAEVRLPSFMISLGPRRSIAFTNRVRSFAQVYGVSENVARLARYGLDEAHTLGLANKLLDDNRFNVGVNNYHEFALTYAQTFTPNTRHFFKGGITAKYLVGLGGGYLVNGGVNYQVYNGDSIQLNSRDVRYGYTDYRYYENANHFKWTDLYGSNRLGQGLGADLGVTYEYRPEAEKYQYHMDGQDWTDHTRNKYKLRLGLAVTDLGAIVYNNSQFVRSAQLANSRTIQWGKLDTLHYHGLNASVDQLLTKVVGLQNQDTRFTTYLPTALRLTADYNVAGHFYTGLLWQQSLLPATTIGTRTVNSLSVTPRLEFSQAELSVPLVLANNYRRFQVGAMLRLGPVFVGSDNLGGIFGVTTTTGYDLYAGLGFTLGKTKHKDKDGDQVSNKLDKCPTVKGVWEFRGCPDRDHDHVQDSEDECPDTPGLAEFKGCPDRDGDKIPDKVDECPDVPGLAEFHGCPDRDGDKVPDKLDDCPDTPGLVALKGCPDRDGDGVRDSDDHCPDVPGPADHFGCPDTDKDGLYDDVDQCPTVAGPVENKGCPYLDTDGDTVLDKDDDCPTVAGPVENKGCPYPDTDGDTVLDKDDACPNTPGPVENKGCPVIAKAEQKVLNTAFANLQFATNKDIILKSSYPSLNALAKLLVDKPEFRLRLRGYTDNVGTPAYNLTLSRKRAQAVQRYLEGKGVPVGHIRSEYFGRANPVATNKTAAGRAKNRRVEMKVEFE